MQDYSFLQKLLHDIILGNKIIQKSLFEIEKKIYSKKFNNKIKENKHLFITGLPRSGTTALLNFFYQTNQFA